MQTEYVVACEFLDEEYPTPAISPLYDNNTYTFGHIGHHNVVIACLPKGKYGLMSVASVARDMLRSFLHVVGAGLAQGTTWRSRQKERKD